MCVSFGGFFGEMGVFFMVFVGLFLFGWLFKKKLT